MNSVYDIVILGGGISGLSQLHFQSQKGKNILLLEQSAHAGGKIQSEKENGFLLEWGPNSFIMDPAISRLIKELDLENEMIFPGLEAKKRAILKHKKLHFITPDPKYILRSGLFSFNGKLRLITEPFRKKDPKQDESVAAFIRRRFGQEVLDYAVDPILAGIYAGDPEQLSVDHVFPMLPQWEKNHGSIIKAAKANQEQMKENSGRKIFSFQNGNDTLTRALWKKYRENICQGLEILSIIPGKTFVKILIRQCGIEKEIHTREIISTIPAYQAAFYFKQWDISLAEALQSIEYPDMMVLHLAYPLQALPFKPDGFGFLVPRKEKMAFLGSVWDSALFPGRAPQETFLCTLFIGGKRNPELWEQTDTTIAATAEKQYREILRITTPPVLQQWRKWPQAIPQYNIGYAAVLENIRRFETRFPNIHLWGNYRGGIGVKDCIKSALDLAFPS